LIDQPWIFSKVLGHDRPYDKGEGRGRQKERKGDRADNGRVGRDKGVEAPSLFDRGDMTNGH